METSISKRKREELEKEAELAFKKCNRLKRTPPNVKRQTEKSKEDEQTDKTEEEKTKKRCKCINRNIERTKNGNGRDEKRDEGNEK